MIYHYIKSFIASAKRNRFFYSINLVGFLTCFLLLTLIFTYVSQELSFDRFHKKVDTIYRLHPAGYGVTPLCFADKLKDKLPEITGMVRFSAIDLAIDHKNTMVPIEKIFYTDPEVFQVFSFPLLSGDAHTALQKPFSIVLNQATAHKLFGNATPLGETLRAKDGKVYTITGVMADIPYNSHLQYNAFVSIETLKQLGDESALGCSTWSNLLYVTLQEKSNRAEVETKINAILDEDKMEGDDGKIQLRLESMKDIYFDSNNNRFDGSKHGNMQTVLLYLGIAILILLTVVINYINLSTAISGSRAKEIAIRKINGAKRIQIIGQILVETVGIALISFAVALAIIEMLLPQLSSLLNLQISASTNRHVLYLGYFVGVVAVGVIAGLIPGVFLSKTNEIKVLKNESTLNARGHHRKILLSIQLIIVAVLLNSTFIINAQIGYLFKKDMGISSQNVVCFRLDKELAEKQQVVRANLLSNPKIKAVTISYALIGDGLGKAPQTCDSNTVMCNINSIDPEYMQLYELKMKYGRNFDRSIPTDSSNSCIVNESTCRALGIENPTDRMFSSKRIVGVVYDFNYTSLHNQIEPLMIRLSNMDDSYVQIKIDENNQNETLQFIRNTCNSLSPTYNGDYIFLEDRITELYKSELDLKRSFQVYSIVTLIVAMLGLFGLTLFMINKKMKEVSLRKLFGAKLSDTFRLLTKEQLWIAAVANILAIPITYWITNRWLSNFQYRVEISALPFLESFIITVILIVLAISFLIVKAHKTKMIDALKHE
ncbi:ABC transporter permease [Williamwhitmania taraxaci]|uniref:Putative ABC transport system permease protein n=1 Tax=Williamwhitmania taraxaci TaxID=1640674 RepID=A0A1G6Q0L7_9BACT|nr:ABC transporter permease [Williamwhitmania taraxaci]SDC85464.1 putative ABC transport system permease protein [Williamwhitmania taraxaci]